MKLKFTKMQGLGNDFVVLDFTKNSRSLSAQQAAHIADRRLGVGCDQILIVENSARDGIDFKYRILNADGSEVGQCGNGARCFVRYVHEKGLSDANPITVETLGGDLVLQAMENNVVKVNMGVPNFEPALIPLNVAKRQNVYTLHYQDSDQDSAEGSVEDSAVEFSALSIGNPHAVILVDDIDIAPVLEMGAVLETHTMFPERANIGFMQVSSRDSIRLRVFERGSGETSACGSGACAAVVAGIQLGLLDSSVKVQLSGGDLSIQWSGEGSAVMMTGAAETSFEGEINL